LTANYHDDETDLVQNWNRFYNATEGRYLELAPMYTSQPAVIEAIASSGGSAPVYNYAANNPVGDDDKDGLVWFKDPSCSTNSSLAAANEQALKIKDQQLRTCVLAQLRDTTSRPMPAGGSIARAGAEWTGASGAGDRWRTAPGEAQGPPSTAATQAGADLADELTDGERVAGEEETSA
jgi:RHS repeat-associated protein